MSDLSLATARHRCQLSQRKHSHTNWYWLHPVSFLDCWNIIQSWTLPCACLALSKASGLGDGKSSMSKEMVDRKGKSLTALHGCMALNSGRPLEALPVTVPVLVCRVPNCIIIIALDFGVGQHISTCRAISVCPNQTHQGMFGPLHSHLPQTAYGTSHVPRWEIMSSHAEPKPEI